MPKQLTEFVSEKAANQNFWTLMQFLAGMNLAVEVDFSDHISKSSAAMSTTKQYPAPTGPLEIAFEKILT